MQTAEYAEALLRGHGQGLAETEIRRKDLLSTESPPRLWLVIAQHVLEAPVGGPAVMRVQLAHLREIAALPNVEIQVIQHAGSPVLRLAGERGLAFLDAIKSGRVG